METRARKTSSYSTTSPTLAAEAAMRGMIRYKQRESGEWVAVGLDGKSRLVELVYIYDEDEDFFLVFRGMTLLDEDLLISSCYNVLNLSHKLI